jgi:hypothetical protein
VNREQAKKEIARRKANKEAAQRRVIAKLRRETRETKEFIRSIYNTVHTIENTITKVHMRSTSSVLELESKLSTLLGLIMTNQQTIETDCKLERKRRTKGDQRIATRIRAIESTTSIQLKDLEGREAKLQENVETLIKAVQQSRQYIEEKVTCEFVGLKDGIREIVQEEVHEALEEINKDIEEAVDNIHNRIDTNINDLSWEITKLSKGLERQENGTGTMITNEDTIESEKQKNDLISIQTEEKENNDRNRWRVKITLPDDFEDLPDLPSTEEETDEEPWMIRKRYRKPEVNNTPITPSTKQEISWEELKQSKREEKAKDKESVTKEDTENEVECHDILEQENHHKYEPVEKKSPVKNVSVEGTLFRIYSSEDSYTSYTYSTSYSSEIDSYETTSSDGE